MSGIINPEPTLPSKPAAPIEGPTQPRPGPPGTEGTKEFHGPEERMKGTESQAAEKPSPMDLMGEGRSRGGATQETVQGGLANLQKVFQNAQNQLKDPAVAHNIRTDQEGALVKLTDKLNGDMEKIAKHSDVEFAPKTQGKDESVLGFVTNWIDGSQVTLGKAMQSAAELKNPDPAKLMNLQYSVQRASQRAELFSTIIGSGVSGIKTIMSTQLG